MNRVLKLLIQETEFQPSLSDSKAYIFSLQLVSIFCKEGKCPITETCLILL